MCTMRASRIQLPAHQYMDDTTHGVGRRNLHFRATLLSHDSCRFAWNRRSYLTLGQFFCEVAIERDPYTQHFEALLSCSASDQSVRHGDGCCQTVLCLRAPYRLTPVSLKTGCCQQFVPRSCHGLELNWRHRDDPAIVRDKTTDPCNCFPRASPFLCWHISQKPCSWRVQGCSKKARRARITLWHHNIAELHNRLGVPL